MILELLIVASFILLFIYSNPRITPEIESEPNNMWDRITFNPFIKAPACPNGCKIISFKNSDLTPSILSDPQTQQMCGYRHYEQDSIIYPCPSTCCGSGSLPAY